MPFLRAGGDAKHATAVNLQTAKSGAIRVIVAEDNHEINGLIQSYLSMFPQVQVVATAFDGEQAMALVEELQPLAVFLDISMPLLNGIQVAVQLQREHPEVLIVFVTAYSHYAAEAYQIGAVDYLTKPLTREAFMRAVRRIEAHANMITFQPAERLILRNGHEVFYIPPDEIIFIEKEVRTTLIHTLHGIYQTTDLLIDLEKKLGPRFYRCGKGYIINLRKVKKIHPIADRLYSVSFYDYDRTVTMGRKKFVKMSSLMEGYA